MRKIPCFFNQDSGNSMPKRTAAAEARIHCESKLRSPDLFPWGTFLG